MRFLVILALSALALSGCTGIPAGAAGPGDFLTVTVTATDPTTGEALLDGVEVQLAMLSGNSGLGFDFERRLLGAAAGDQVRFDKDPAVDYDQTVRVESSFDPIPLVADIGRNQFEGVFGPATAGMEFAPDFSFYRYRVEAVDNTTVTYRILAEDGQRNDVPQVGAVLVTHVDEAADTMTQSLDPAVGTTFQIAPPTPYNPTTPLGLAPGSYVTLGATATQIEYGFANTQYPQLLGRAVHFQVEVIEIQQGLSVQDIPEDGNIGVRNSPVVDGVVDPEPDFGAYLDLGDDGGAGDGHADDGHTH